MQWLRRSSCYCLNLLQAPLCVACSDHCLFESKPGEVSSQEEIMHFIGGVLLLLLAMVWAAPEPRKEEPEPEPEPTQKEDGTHDLAGVWAARDKENKQVQDLEKWVETLGNRGLEAIAGSLERVKLLGERNELEKADELARKPPACESVIPSCAVVYESADCKSGWNLTIKEVLLIVFSNY